MTLIMPKSYSYLKIFFRYRFLFLFCVSFCCCNDGASRMQSRTCSGFAEAQPIFATQLQKYNLPLEKIWQIPRILWPFFTTFKGICIKIGPYK